MRLFQPSLPLVALGFLFLGRFVSAAGLEDTPEQIAKGVHLVSLTELVLLTSKDKPDERLVLLFTRFNNQVANYKWLYFNPLTQDWVTGSDRVQEVYDKVPEGDHALRVVPVPGHNTKIQAGGISLEWSRGNSKSCWIYTQPNQVSVKKLPADQFGKVENLK